MKTLKINGTDVGLGYFISLFDNNIEEESKILNHLYQCRFDGFGLGACDGWINNIKVEYNQNFVLHIDSKEIFITNFDLMDKEDKFYKFQDNNTFKSLKTAIKKFIKLILKG